MLLLIAAKATQKKRLETDSEGKIIGFKATARVVAVSNKG
jgi:hypothetical protein